MLAINLRVKLSVIGCTVFITMTQVDDILDLECTLSLVHTLDFDKFTNKFFIELMIAALCFFVRFTCIKNLTVLRNDTKRVNLSYLSCIANETKVPAFKSCVFT